MKDIHIIQRYLNPAFAQENCLSALNSIGYYRLLFTYLVFYNTLQLIIAEKFAWTPKFRNKKS